MVSTRKRPYSGDAESSAAQKKGGRSSRSKLASPKTTSVSGANGKGDDIVQLWQHGVAVADLSGDTIDPNVIPNKARSHVLSSLDAPFLQRSGIPREAIFAPRFPFGGGAHTLSQALANRHSSLQYHINQSQFLSRDSFGGHLSCVNALAFSRDQGRYLASGGDDCQIHIRDMFVNLSSEQERVPLVILHGHRSNIFSLSWAAQDKYLFSTGNGGQILYYDVEHSSLPIRGTVPMKPEPRLPLNPSSIGGHDDSVPEISAHPTNPNLLLSCDDSGNFKLIDIRISHEAVAAARSDAVAGFASVQWNPNTSDGNTFAAATCGRITGSTRLYDVRQCFGSDEQRPMTNKDAVVSYHTALMQNSSTRGLIAAAAETNSICFDPHGRLLASSISRYHPTIYAVNDPDPLATLESTVIPDPIDDGYCKWLGIPEDTPSAPKKLSSCCTIKHGSFGLESQTGRLHYAIGSDDFRAYVFAIPSRDELALQREYVNREKWLHDTAQLHPQAPKETPKLAAAEHSAQSKTSQPSGGEARATGSDNDDDDGDSDLDLVPEEQVDHDSEVAYCAGSILRAPSIVRPARLNQFAHVLCGGRSIINTALIHPSLPLILTAGITSDIDIHSASWLSAVELRPATDYDSDARKKGGTRPRLLLPPTKAALIDEDSEVEDDEDDEMDFGVAGGTDGIPLVIGFGARARARSYARQQAGDDDDDAAASSSDDDSQSHTDDAMQEDTLLGFDEESAELTAQDQVEAVTEAAAENQLAAIEAVAVADFDSDDDTPFVDLGDVTDSADEADLEILSHASSSEIREEQLDLFREAQSARLPEPSQQPVQSSVNDLDAGASQHEIQIEQNNSTVDVAEPNDETTAEVDNAAQSDAQTEDNKSAEAAEPDVRTTTANEAAEPPVSSCSSEASSSGSKYTYRRTSSNEEALYDPSAPTRSRESEERQMNQMRDMIRTIQAEDTAEREARRQRRRRRGEIISDDEDYVSADEGNRVASTQPQQGGEEGEATVENFLTAMRNDPMYSTNDRLDFQHDRHIGTYSLSHLPPHLVPSESSASTPSTSPSDPSSGVDSYPYMDDESDYDPFADYDEFEDDGYHSTFADTESLTNRVLGSNLADRDVLLAAAAAGGFGEDMEAVVGIVLAEHIAAAALAEAND
ncbi:hypothetical protein NDA16_003365 [Ustilago loliicola]|nr:hypothetical protein NDA16_003365 [Ustilago loliicola]